jgi:hypothetical protein
MDLVLGAPRILRLPMPLPEMKQFAAKLQPPDQTQLSGEEKALCKLAIECEGLAKRILELLEKVQPKKPKSRGSSIVAGVKTKFYESERRKLEEQLSNFRGQLALSLNYLTRQDILSIPQLLGI